MSSFEFVKLCDEATMKSVAITHWEPVPGNIGFLVDFFISEDCFVYVGAELFEGLWLATIQNDSTLVTAQGTRSEIADTIAQFADNINT